MPTAKARVPKGFKKALEIGRPPNVVKLFPHSQALIVSGKFVDRAMRTKGGAIAMAANGRNAFVIRGVLRAAQKANAAVIIEIAKSEGGAGAYCAVNFWNIAHLVDTCCNQMGITVPVAVHADHYGIKGDKDVGGCPERDPLDVRRGHHLHRDRCLAHDRRPEPAGEHRPELLRPEVGRP